MEKTHIKHFSFGLFFVSVCGDVCQSWKILLRDIKFNILKIYILFILLYISLFHHPIFFYQVERQLNHSIAKQTQLNDD